MYNAYEGMIPFVAKLWWDLQLRSEHHLLESTQNRHRNTHIHDECSKYLGHLWYHRWFSRFTSALQHKPQAKNGVSDSNAIATAGAN